MSEFVYVFTNEAMPGLVKIGRTTDLKNRMRDLYKTGVPTPFDCHYAVQVDDTATAIDVERKLHTLFTENRVNKNREFFRVSPERVVTALSIGNFKAVNLTLSELEETEGEIEKEDIDAVVKEEKRRERINLVNIGIPIGSTLTFTRDASITCITLENSRVLYNGNEESLSSAAAHALQVNYNVSGSLYWMYDGNTLDERRQKIEDGINN